MDNTLTPPRPPIVYGPLQWTTEMDYAKIDHHLKLLFQVSTILNQSNLLLSPYFELTFIPHKHHLPWQVQVVLKLGEGEMWSCP